MSNQNFSDTGLTLITGNEITSTGKIIAGILFIFFTVSAIVALIAYWPDKLPRGDARAVYRNSPFKICLLDSNNQYEAGVKNNPLLYSKADSSHIDSMVNRLIGSANLHRQSIGDTTGNINRSADSAKISSALYSSQKPANKINYYGNVIELNTLLLILVSIAGFLGTMIHITSSFTNYVGAEKFRKSWLLWYFVKPFTGAALALVLYFVFRTGLLNFNDTSNINLYGIITIAIFAGLFTDKATMKLAEIFEVIFRTSGSETGKNDERPDKLESDEVNLKITGIKPENLVANTDNNLIISGEGFNNKKLMIKIDDDEIQHPVIKGDLISLTYKIPDNVDKKEFLLRIFDEQGKEIYSNKLLKGDK